VKDARGKSYGFSQRECPPPGVEAVQISGPLFFGTAKRLDDLLDQFRIPPRIFILRMRLVPMIDASGVHALQALFEHCHRRGIVQVVLQRKARHLADACASARGRTAFR
jgi:SulP family sulfate permease